MKTSKPSRIMPRENELTVITSQDQQLTPLSPDEKEELQAHISEIQAGFQTFFRVAYSLSCIWKQKLYRETHNSFESFCKDVLEISKGHAYRLLDAAEIHECLSKVDGVVLPKTEAHIRPLVSVPRPKLVKVWKSFLDQENGKRITAAKIESFVSDFSTKKKEIHREQWKERVFESMKKIKTALKSDNLDEILMEIERMKLNVEQIGGLGRRSTNGLVDLENSSVGI